LESFLPPENFHSSFFCDFWGVKSIDGV